MIDVRSGFAKISLGDFISAASNTASHIYELKPSFRTMPAGGGLIGLVVDLTSELIGAAFWSAPRTKLYLGTLIGGTTGAGIYLGYRGSQRRQRQEHKQQPTET